MSGQMHKDLVVAAAAWLRRQGCVVVITDLVSGAGETPDAIGFSPYGSILVECKASRADFRADAQKPFRRPGFGGMGHQRYFMAPEGVIPRDGLPENWGLLEVKANGRVFRAAPAKGVEADQSREQRLLISAMRRIGQNAPQGISVKCYTIETERTATVGVVPLSPETEE